MTIDRRLRALERRGSACGACLGAVPVFQFEDDPQAQPQASPPPCPSCGRAPAVVVFAYAAPGETLLQRPAC